MSYRSGTSVQTALGSLDGNTISSSSIDKCHEIDASDIILKGQLRKLKRMKKKFFVLRGDSAIHGPARLEYYDNEKKWRHGLPPKRSIVLKTCFSINRKSDSKHKLALALYTRDDCFAVACESEEELEAWLGSMLLLQRGKTETGGTPRPTFEHLWQVNVKKKGLGGQQNIVGPYRLCLSATSLTLVKMPHTEPSDTKEFQLMSIRRCGHSDGFFYMELGRSSCTGAGELWMQTEDNTIAQNMHEAILNAMRACVKEDLPPRPRTRSSSATESSKPISVGGRRQTTPGATSLIRDRADSLSSRPRTISEGPNITVAYSGSHPNQSEVMHQMGHRDKNSHLFTPDHQRPTSVYSRAISSSPPPTSVLASPGSIACSTDSASSSLSIDDHDLAAVLTIHHHHLHGGSGGRLSYSHTPENSLPSEPAIVEESDDYMNMAGGAAGAEDNASNGIHAQQPSDTDQSGNYLSMTPKASLASSPVATRTCVSANKGSKPASMKSRLGLAHMPLKSTSGSQNAYMDMSSSNASPWSPSNTHDAYMPMAPGEKSGHHTRSSSIGEDAPDGYVPMAPQCIDEHAAYMDMKPRRSLPRDVHARGRMSPASSCSLASSVTSGTPSLSLGTPPPPLRLADFHLDKVASLLTPSEDDDLPPLGGRPFRAYSVGSRPDYRPKMRLETIPSPEVNHNPRVRAFSVGSKRSSNVIARPEIILGLLPATTGSSSASQPRKKSLSAPLLNSSPFPASWQSSSILKNVFFGSLASPRCRPGGDLMVVDYNGGHQEVDKTKSPHRYVSSDSLGSSIADRDPGDREHDERTGTSYGSSDSLGKASCSSLTPSSRPRSNSKTSFLHRAAGKLESVRRTDKKHHAKHDIERLESVPQGRDTDYVEYNSCQSPSADEYMPMNAPTTPRSLSRSSSRVSKRSSRNTSKEDLQRTSESNSLADDEYVELVRPPSVRKTSLKEKKRRSKTAPVPSLSTDNNEYLPMEPVLASPHIDSAYLDMSLPGTRKDPPANEYLPMSYNENRTSRPNSLHKSSSRNSREIRNEDYMEMTFGPSSDMDKLKQKMRCSAPASPDGIDHGAKTGLTLSHAKNSSSTSFLSSLLGKKYSVGTLSKIATPPMDDKTGNTLPRSARSMPPSPFSSLKRSKSTKPRLLSSEDPPTPSEDTSPPAYSTGGLKRHSEPKMLPHFPKPGSLFSRTGSSPRNPSHYPLTPPSPDCPSNSSFAQLSPPTGVSVRPNSSQPISIVHTEPSLATRRGVNSNDSNGSGPHPPFELYVTRMSASPRQHPPPPLSPLPEVLFPISPCGFEPSPTATPTVANTTASLLPPPATKLVTSPSANESAYLPMDFARPLAPIGLLVPLPLTANPATLSPVRDDLPPLPSPETDSEKSVTESTPSLNSSVSMSEATTPTKAVSQSATTLAPLAVDKENKENGSFTSKLRAASLEKIVVGALDKVRTGISHHRRHNSGDKPRKSNVHIYRSNSYQPAGSRNSVVGLFTPVPSKPAASASSFSTLGDIPAGKLVTNDVASSQLSPGHSKTATKPMVANRLSSSSLASLGEEMAISAELQAVAWAPTSPCTIFTCNPSAPVNLSPALQANSSSPSPSSSTSRPPSVLGEQQRELHYATLDLAPMAPKDDEAPRSPRPAVTARPGSSFAFPSEGGASSGLSYAKIDFKKSEGLRNISTGMTREKRNS